VPHDLPWARSFVINDLEGLAPDEPLTFSVRRHVT
jgi:hypothetical protein